MITSSHSFEPCFNGSLLKINSSCPSCFIIGRYLTISRQRRGEYEHVTTEPEATNCFSINFQVNIRILRRKLCVYLRCIWRTPAWTSQVTRRVFVKYKLKVTTFNLYFTLKILGEVLFMIFLLFCSSLHDIAHTFPNIFAHDSYTIRRHFEKCYSHQAAIDNHLRVQLHRPMQIARNVIATSKFILKENMRKLAGFTNTKQIQYSFVLVKLRNFETSFWINVLSISYIIKKCPVYFCVSEPYGPPTGKKVTYLDGSTISFSWSAPHQELHNGVIIYYHVCIREYGNSSCTGTAQTLEMSYTFTDLSPSSEYVVVIKAATIVGQGPPAFIQKTAGKKTCMLFQACCKVLQTSSRCVYTLWFVGYDPYSPVMRNTADDTIRHLYVQVIIWKATYSRVLTRLHKPECESYPTNRSV